MRQVVEADGVDFHMARLKRRRSITGAQNSNVRFRAMFEAARELALEDLSAVQETLPDRSASILVRTASLRAWVRERHPDWSATAGFVDTGSGVRPVASQKCRGCST